MAGGKHWTLDTCVLYAVAKTDVEAIHLLCHINYEGDSIVLDSGKQILRQYERCLKKTRAEVSWDLLNSLFKMLICTRPVITRDGSVSNRNAAALLDRGFSNKDMVFVGVCAKSNEKHLVTVDSDYNDQVKAYLSEEMQVLVTDIANALDAT
jgi:hypothetical protein